MNACITGSHGVTSISYARNEFGLESVNELSLMNQ